jgi:hypothetical protein
MNNLIIKKSKNKNKKFDAILSDDKGNKKVIPFGAAGYSDFILSGGDKKKREAYIKRHAKNEDWNKINAGSLSRYILWGNSSNMETNIKDFMKKFNLK